MEKFIPINKKTKKEQKEYHARQRRTWSMDPVTRTVPNGKGYNRNKQKQEDRRSGRLSQNYRDDCHSIFLFARSNEPSSRACTDIWRLPRSVEICLQISTDCHLLCL